MGRHSAANAWRAYNTFFIQGDCSFNCIAHYILTNITHSHQRFKH